ncbi:MAG: TlpA family protein disulfide reductase [Bacteroidales bacterium]|nr:TlpA family protein disulfide reductase [Bacteroidales bacterium]MCL2132786.1 TlpA family protein disulfide reductase [Bacteroidales bacterium]
MKKIVLLSVLAIMAWSCSQPSANISGCISSAPDTKFSISRLGATTQLLLDTIRTDAKGCFKYKYKMPNATEPAFLLLTTDSLQLTLLVNAGEKVELTSDGGPEYMVSGSENSLLLKELNKNFNISMLRFDSLYKVLDEHKGTKDYDAVYKQINIELGSVYVKQKRDAIKFIFQNPTSFAAIAAIYQRYPDGLPVFAATSDGVYFKMLHDSLQSIYPNSAYVAALRDEYEYRMRNDELSSINVEEIGFPDLDLPDVNAQKIKLSAIKDKVILIYFWVSANIEQRMENNELINLYNKYSSKGFEIYQVALDTDKPAWAKQVKTQGLPWVNVCDGLGTGSRAIQIYNIQRVPASFIIDKSGQIVASNIFGKDLEKKIAELCK